MANSKECGAMTDSDPRAIKTVLESTERNGNKTELVHISEGWEIAGSAMRWTSENYAVQFVIGNHRGSRRFKTEQEARNLYTKWASE